MKTIKILIIACFGMLMFYSCSKGDIIKQGSSNPIENTWSLVHVSCECEPVILEPGQQTWTFDLDESKLIVVNNVIEELHTILQTGEYPIIVTENTVLLNEITFDYYFENEKLYLSDHPEVDGPLIEFVQ